MRETIFLINLYVSVRISVFAEGKFPAVYALAGSSPAAPGPLQAKILEREHAAYSRVVDDISRGRYKQIAPRRN